MIVNDSEREQWIDSNRELHSWYKQTGRSMPAFIRANRVKIDQAIAKLRLNENLPVESVPEPETPSWLITLIGDVCEKYHVHLDRDDALDAVEQLRKGTATDIVLSCAHVDCNRNPQDITFVLSGDHILLVTMDLLMVDLGEDA